MPELPEVETVRKGLEDLLENRPVIKHVHLTRGDIRFPIPNNFASALEGATITGVKRRAKYLLIETSKFTLLSHLGMTGSWRIDGETSASERAALSNDQRAPLSNDQRAPLDRHDHCFIELSDHRTMVFRDPRRFGVLDVVPPGEEMKHKLLKSLGPEPFDTANFSFDKLFARSRKRKVSIKVFIMDQKTVVGVGNIYASEALFVAGIRPQKQAGKLSRKEVELLVEAVREVLAAAIEAGGSSIRTYKNADGASGAFQDAHQVYERDGEACRKCRQPIRSKILGGRSTYWCSRCQK